MESFCTVRRMEIKKRISKEKTVLRRIQSIAFKKKEKVF